MAQILIIEDESLLRRTLATQLGRGGHTVLQAGSLQEAKEHLRQQQPDVLLLDLSLPDGHGLDFYEQHGDQLEDTVTLVMTALGEVEDAVRAMKLGALDFLTKPVAPEELERLVERSLALKEQQREAQVARRDRESRLQQTLIAESNEMQRVLEMARDVARSDVNSILLVGESGTGKNVLARYLHASSARSDKPLLELSCASIPDTLMESELLGHEKGAFTDAKATRRGIFELGAGGSIVLDEIGELKLDLQAKLLHVLEERRLRRVGGSREIFVDVRVIALTNRDLPALVRSGGFRSDLFFRLNVFPIEVPPLRERPRDILPLARHFLATLQPNLSRRFEGFGRETENLLLGYSWPGNVRELRNVVEHLVVLVSPGAEISADEIPFIDDQPLDGYGAGPAFSAAVMNMDYHAAREHVLGEFETAYLKHVVQSAGGNISDAARMAGVDRTTLYRLMEKHGTRRDSLIQGEPGAGESPGA